jgi:hypothetical protein
MLVYHYSRDTQEYLSCEEARKDPEYGQPLCPAHATFIKPQQPIEGGVMIFKEERQEWIEVEDHRGEVWDKETKLNEQWRELGKLPPNLTRKVPQFKDEWDKEKNNWVGHEEWIKRKYEYELSYKFRREKQYPLILDQLDMLYWDKINGTNNWVDSITKVKEKHPKPENENEKV